MMEVCKPVLVAEKSSRYLTQPSSELDAHYDNMSNQILFMYSVAPQYSCLYGVCWSSDSCVDSVPPT